MPILDQYGRPIAPTTVRRASESSNAALFDPTKRRWQQTVARGLSPARLGEVLRLSDEGQHRDLMTLAREMTERDLGLFRDLNTRTLSIAGAPLHAEAMDDTSKRGRKIAETCQELVIDQPNFRFLLHQIMDAILIGFSVNAVLWDTSTTPWTFADFEFVDPRHFVFDYYDIRKLLLRTDLEPLGVPMPQNFMVHWPRLRPGMKLRGGLMRLCAIAELAKTDTLSGWMAFAEVYGMPLRIGKYNPDVATELEIEQLRSSLVNLGHDACAIIPESMNIEFADARRPPSGDNLYHGLAQYWDGQRTGAILGTTPGDQGSSAGEGPAIAETRREVSTDIREWDALCVSATVQNLLDQWVTFNYGASAPRVRLRLDVESEIEIEAFTAGVLPWVREAGLAVPKAWLRRRLGIPEQKEGEEMLEPPMLPGATPGGDHAGAALDGATRGQPQPGKSPKV